MDRKKKTKKEKKKKQTRKRSKGRKVHFVFQVWQAVYEQSKTNQPINLPKNIRVKDVIMVKEK